MSKFNKGDKVIYRGNVSEVVSMRASGNENQYTLIVNGSKTIGVLQSKITLVEEAKPKEKPKGRPAGSKNKKKVTKKVKTVAEVLKEEGDPNATTILD